MAWKSSLTALVRIQYLARSVIGPLFPVKTGERGSSRTVPVPALFRSSSSIRLGISCGKCCNGIWRAVQAKSVAREQDINVHLEGLWRPPSACMSCTCDECTPIHPEGSQSICSLVCDPQRIPREVFAALRIWFPRPRGEARKKGAEFTGHTHLTVHPGYSPFDIFQDVLT